MGQRLTQHDGTNVMASVPGVGSLISHGDGAPTDSVQGFAKGGLWLDTTNGRCYINYGTRSSSNWGINPGWLNVMGYGAVADGTTDDAAAIQAALDAAGAMGGGVVYCPQGDYLVASAIQLGDNTTLKIGDGAVLKRGWNQSVPVAVASGKHGGSIIRQKSNSSASPNSNVHVVGPGTIDTNGMTGPVLAMSFIAGGSWKNIKLIADGNGDWAATIQDSSQFNISGVDVRRASGVGFEDGIHVDGSCTYCTLSDCFVQSGDDSYAFTANEVGDDMKHITMTNCVGVNYNAFAIKVFARDGGTLEHLTISNVTSQYGVDTKGGIAIWNDNSPAGGELKNVSIRNCSFRTAVHNELQAWPLHIRDVEDVSVSGVRWDTPNRGLYLETSSNISLSDFDVITPGNGYEALDIEGCSGVEVRPNYIRCGTSSGITIDNSSDISVVGGFIDNVGLNTAGVGISNTSGAVRVVGVKVKANTNCHGVRVTTASGCSDLAVSNCDFSEIGTGTHGIFPDNLPSGKNLALGINLDGTQASGVEAFSADDSTPDVSGGNSFKTANANPTTITDFDSGIEGQEIFVMIDDANTTIDFTGSSLRGNAGADWSPSQYDSMRCTLVGTDWICDISDNTS